MQAVYPTRKIEVRLNGVWTDITSDVVSEIKASWGINGNGILDRVASTGTLSFSLNNVTKKYTPASGTSNPYWKKGVYVRLIVSFDGADYIRFYGRIQDIKIKSGETGERTVSVSCVDWLDFAANYPITLAQAVPNQRADEAVGLLVDGMPVQPQARSFDTGTDEFATVFDTIKENTKALSEFAKITLSEYGYLYLRKDRQYGETLRVESRHSRDGLFPNPIPVANAFSGHLLTESGDFLLLESGDRLLCDESEYFNFNNNMLSLDTMYGDNIANYVSIKVYPRVVDSTPKVLFSQNSTIALASGETKSNIKGSFVDPNGGGTKINGVNMIAPAAVTDYQMFENQNGTGADLTANLTVTASYGTDGVVFSLTNTGGSTGYVRKLQARGYAVYVYNVVEQFMQDDTSILDNGYQAVTIDQKYSSTLLPNNTLINRLLTLNKNPRTVVNKISLLANISSSHMLSFLCLDVGDLIRVIENQSGVNGSFFISNVSFTISLGGIINCTWGLKEATTLSDAFWYLGMDGASELGINTVVGY